MSHTPRTVLVGAATGKQGNAVANLLVEHGHNVIAYVRDGMSEKAKALELKGVKLTIGDLGDAKALAEAARGVDAIFSVTIPFGTDGLEEEIVQGKALADAAASSGAHLVYSSVAGADNMSGDAAIEHVNSKQVIEAYIKAKGIDYTIVAPFYIMENLLNFDFNQLKDGTYASPLSIDRKLDQVTVLDIAAMAVFAIEHPDRMLGQRVEVASASISGEEIVAALSKELRLTVGYYKIPMAQIRSYAGDEIADMFEEFEKGSYYTDIPALHAQYPQIKWHTLKDWVQTIDWKTLLA